MLHRQRHPHSCSSAATSQRLSLYRPVTSIDADCLDADNSVSVILIISDIWRQAAVGSVYAERIPNLSPALGLRGPVSPQS
jgi:hypothetical protein